MIEHLEERLRKDNAEWERIANEKDKEIRRLRNYIRSLKPQDDDKTNGEIDKDL